MKLKIAPKAVVCEIVNTISVLLKEELNDFSRNVKIVKKRLF